MKEIIDFRCRQLAEYLSCDPKMVESHYLTTGASIAIDSHQNDELKSDLERLYKAKKYTEKVLDELSKLSKIAKATQLLGGPQINVMTAELYENLQGVVLSGEQLRADNTAKGGINIKAHLIAKVVECVFNELGWNVSFGGPTNGSDPRTKFCQAVHKAIRIFDVKSRTKTNSSQFTHEDSDYADWQSPCKAIYQNRLSRGQKN
mgnify:FL=1